MASSITFRNAKLYLVNILLNKSLLNSRWQALYVGHKQTYATSCKELGLESQPRVAVSPDKNCIICWHPEPEFPYEYTQPIIRNNEEWAEGDSPLKVNLLLEEKLKMRADGPTDNELCHMFSTTKHEWRPKPQKKFRRPEGKPDREGL